jgi:hypothetical protein
VAGATTLLIHTDTSARYTVHVSHAGYFIYNTPNTRVPLFKLSMPVANGVDRRDNDDTAGLGGAEEDFHKRDNLWGTAIVGT